MSIRIIYGTNAAEMTYALLKDAGVEKALPVDGNIVLKPNLVVAKPAAEGATTHPEIVEGLLGFLKDHGCAKIAIAEGSWLGETTDRTFERCGYKALAKKFGVNLFDTKKDEVVRKNTPEGTFAVCRTIAESDYLVNLPVLKGHCQTTLTCCLKNMKGCIPDGEKRRYHTIGLHRPIAVLNTILKPNLHLVDAICGDPTFEEGGNPVVSNRILLGTDPVLLDSYGAALLGYEPNEIDYLRFAAEYGLGRLFDETATVRELNVENRPKTNLTGQGNLVKRLAGYVEERNACSACYAALIFALNKTGVRPKNGKIKIGQAFRGKTCEGFGVGNCTSGCTEFVPGCPPTAAEIAARLTNFKL